MTLYLDASVLVALMVKEDGALAVADLLDADERPLTTSDFARAETSAALARLVRMAILSTDQLKEALARLDDWTSAATRHEPLSPGDVAAANRLVRQPELALRAPDAIHIAAARRLDATLLTLDNGMTRAARALRLPCINPAETSALKA